MAHIEYDITSELRDEIAFVLRPETDFDTHETALWLNVLLHRIHREVRPIDLEQEFTI